MRGRVKELVFRFCARSFFVHTEENILPKFLKVISEHDVNEHQFVQQAQEAVASAIQILNEFYAKVLAVVLTQPFVE